MSDYDVVTMSLMLARLERLNDAFATGVCQRHGTTPSEIRVLAVLRFGAGGEGVRPGVISRRVVLTSGGLTATMRRLEALDYIERQDDPDDKRGRLVRLTESGRQFYDAVLHDLTTRYELAFHDLNMADHLDSVRALVGAFERFDNLPVSGDWSVAAAASTEQR